jgi:hypothetical protein
MRLKLRYVLPMVQIFVGIALCYWFDRWFYELKGVSFSGVHGPSPGFALLASLNAPVLLVWVLCFRHLSWFWDCWVLISLGALWWYWVGLNVEYWRREKRAFLFLWTPLHIGADLVLIADGAYWAFVLIYRRNVIDLGLFSSWSWIAYLGPFIFWAVVLVVFFGRDLIQSIRGLSQTR